mgnify:CR=1 FL=1
MRLTYENAKAFYELVQSTGIAKVPLIDVNGKRVVDAKTKQPKMIKTYRTLIIVQDFVDYEKPRDTQLATADIEE